VLKAGHAFGETAEIFGEHYAVEPAEMAAGPLPGDDGQSRAPWGSSRRRSAPRSPSSTARIRSRRASDILHELALHKPFRVRRSRPRTRSRR